MTSFLAKANPDIYDLDCFLKSPLPQKTLWPVCKDAKAENILYLAKCGKKAGIFAVARITEKPIPRKDDINDPCWTTLGKESSVGREIRLRSEIEVFDKINLPESELRRYPIWEKKLTWLHGQGTCCHLHKEEEDAIQSLTRELGIKR